MAGGGTSPIKKKKLKIETKQESEDLIKNG